jgi:hypothetical protein
MKTLFDPHNFLLDLEAIHGEEKAKQEFLVLCLKDALEEKQLVEQTEILNAYSMLKISPEYIAEKQRREDKWVEIRKQMSKS